MRVNLPRVTAGSARMRAQRRDSRAVRTYLEQHAVAKLHLGAGHNSLDGWLNTDRSPRDGQVALDLGRSFPFPDAGFDYVFSEHLLEHLPYDSGLGMLREARRVLRAGGRIRVATPDLGALASAVVQPGSPVAARYGRWLKLSYFAEAYGPDMTFAFNQVMRGWGHRFLYDEPTLTQTLQAAGFTDVVRRGFRESLDPHLSALENHGVPDGNEDLTRFETMCVEATCP